jgi:hypothetical protein
MRGRGNASNWQHGKCAILQNFQQDGLGFSTGSRPLRFKRTQPWAFAGRRVRASVIGGSPLFTAQ